MKLVIYSGILVGGALGGWLGAALDQGNWLGAWSILLGGVGSLLGIWIGYKVGQASGL